MSINALVNGKYNLIITIDTYIIIYNFLTIQHKSAVNIRNKKYIIILRINCNFN